MMAASVVTDDSATMHSLMTNGSHSGAEYKQVAKQQKAHGRTIVGLQVFREPRTRQLTLATFAHDSLKLWSITAFDDDFELFPIRTVRQWNCGIQSYTTSADRKRISLVSTDCSLHHIWLGETDVQEPRLEVVHRGLMEMWFVQLVDEQRLHYLTVNFQAGQLQIVDASGQVIIGAHFEKARQISAICYSEKFVAAGSSQGVLHVLSACTLAPLYSNEAHAMKVRCLLFFSTGGGGDEPGQQQQEELEPSSQNLLLTGSDDKTIKLFALTETRASVQRIFCGHQGIVTGLAVCAASQGQRFASSGADNCLIVWAMQSGQKLHRFDNCTGTINDVPRCVAFTPNGRYLLAGTEESALLAHRVPQPDNYVEEPLPPDDDEVEGEEDDEVERQLLLMETSSGAEEEPPTPMTATTTAREETRGQQLGHEHGEEEKENANKMREQIEEEEEYVPEAGGGGGVDGYYNQLLVYGQVSPSPEPATTAAEHEQEREEQMELEEHEQSQDAHQQHEGRLQTSANEEDHGQEEALTVRQEEGKEVGEEEAEEGQAQQRPEQRSAAELLDLDELDAELGID